MELTSTIIDAAANGRRIGQEEGLALLRNADLLTLGDLANTARRRLHPERIVTYIIDRNINYTNICVNKCAFCAFYRDQESPDAYVLNREDLAVCLKILEEALKVYPGDR